MKTFEDRFLKYLGALMAIALTALTIRGVLFMFNIDFVNRLI